MDGDRVAHALALSEELLADIELERLPLGSIVLKAARLARFMEDDTAQGWLSFELSGAPARTPEVERWLTSTGRWENRKEGKYWPYPAAQIDSTIAASEAQLATLKLPNLSGESITVATGAVIRAQAQVRSQIAKFSGMRAKIVASLHEFTSRHDYALKFTQYQAELFDDARLRVSKSLAPLSSGALDKVDPIYRRLAEGDIEGISQALTTCRRLIDSIADEIFPPTDETRTLNGNEVKLTKQHIQNRLSAFIQDNTESKSRRTKLRRMLNDLYERVNSGVHGDVAVDEARYLFLNTYMFLGEVLALRAPQPEVQPLRG